jgi:hypothetical protein
MTDKPPKSLDKVRADIRTRRYSIRTEHSYADRICRFILVQNKRHPSEMGKAEMGPSSPALPLTGESHHQRKKRIISPLDDVFK